MEYLFESDDIIQITDKYVKKETLKRSIENDNTTTVIAKIKKLAQKGYYDEALMLCDLDGFKDNTCIHSQKVKILMLLFDSTLDKSLLEEALKICRQHDGMDLFDVPKEKIKKRLKQLDYLVNNSIVTIGLTNVYSDNISEEEIEKYEISDWKKSLLLLAYYEKSNKAKGIKYLKSIKAQYDDNSKRRKILNEINERLVSKKIKIFAVNKYCNYLNCTINFELIDGIKKEETAVVENKVENKVLPTVEPVIKKKKQKIHKYVTSTGKPGFSRYTQNNNNQLCSSSVSVNKVRLIKDVFSQEVLEIGKYLYVEMNNFERQRDAIKAWDNFESLINKPSDNIEAMERMIRILKNFQVKGLLSTTTNYDEIKVLKKNIY